MRSAQTLTLLLALTAAPMAMAAEVSATSAPSAKSPEATAAKSAPPPAAPEPSLPWLGIQLDAGVPDGAQAALVLRPWRALRFTVGGGYNVISKGVRGGLSLLPFGRGPSLTVEAGRFFEGDANAAARKYMGDFQDIAVLQRVGYDFANAHLGLDFGYKRVTFFIHGGMSYLRGKVRDANQFFTDPSIDGMNADGVSVKFTQDPTVVAIGPSAKIGLIVYLW
jgi:hypothetical protein